MTRKLRQIFVELTKPYSLREEAQHHEFVLNVVLLVSIVLSFLALLRVLVQEITMGMEYSGVPSFFILIILLTFLLLYYLSRRGRFIISAYILVILYLIPTIIATYLWGVGIPQVLLIYVFVILISGVLISTRVAFMSAIFISIVLLLIAYLQIEANIQPDTSWQRESFKIGDVLGFVVTFAIMTVISWLYNREVERSLTRARRSEEELRKQRDNLEVRVEERTRDLQRVQLERISQLSQFAEFGRLTSGVLHDLANPLTTISLNLEKIRDIQSKELNGTKTNLQKALGATRRMEEYIQALLGQLRQQDIRQRFNVAKETNRAIQLINFRARRDGVEIISNYEANPRIVGNPIKIQQLVSNLIANAIDSYKDLGDRGQKKVVRVELSEAGETICLKIIDQGCGIAPDKINNIFDPFYTTKGPNRGLGFGLTIAKDITEGYFKGTISLKSRLGKGTEFIIQIPRRKN